MLKFATLLTAILLTWPSVGTADVFLGSCELRPLDEVDGWEWLKTDERFDLAEVCTNQRLEEDSSISSIFLFGHEKRREKVVYREEFVALANRKVLGVGLTLPTMGGDGTTMDLHRHEYVSLNSTSNSDLNLDVYENGILWLEDCVSSNECMNELLTSYPLLLKWLDDDYGHFKDKLLGMNGRSRQELISHVNTFWYDADTNRLSFDVVLSPEKDWHVELALTPSGEVDQLASVWKSQIIP